MAEERQSSAFERKGSASRGATPATDVELEGAGGQRGEQEASPASPASPASEARARVVSPSNRMGRLKKRLESVPVSCKIQEATPLPPLRARKHDVQQRRRRLCGCSNTKDGRTAGRRDGRQFAGLAPAPADPSENGPCLPRRAVVGFSLSTGHWTWREKNRPVYLRLISA